MPNSLSAIKRVRQNETRRARNRSDRTRLRGLVKQLRQAIESKNAEEAKKLLPGTASFVDKMVKKGVLHERTGNRYKSRLSRQLSALSSS